MNAYKTIVIFTCRNPFLLSIVNFPAFFAVIFARLLQVTAAR